jgi:RNA polymerase sigma-70 factor, ECF subfamily
MNRALTSGLEYLGNIERRIPLLPTPDTLPDETLARSLQRGDSRALAALVERHHSFLLGYLYRMTSGDHPLAEDLVQETFLRVLRNIRQYHYPERFKPWLYAIATNLARDHYKRADTRHTDSINTDTLHLPDSDQPEPTFLAHDDAKQVIAALAALPDLQRETVILRYYQDLSLAEIAESLNIPVGTVKSRLSTGLQKLREHFEENSP